MRTAISTIHSYALIDVLYRRRTSIALIITALIMLIGQLKGFYPFEVAVQKIPIEVVVLIFILSLFSKEFERRGILNYLSLKSANMTRGKRHLLICIFLITVFGFSLFANNLSVIITFTYICLRIGLALRLPMVPLLVGAIISSNIGGCPLPWSDLPAIILMTYGSFSITDFLFLLFPPCLLFIFLLIIYALWKARTQYIPLSTWEEHVNFESFRMLSKFDSVNWKKSTLPIFLFLLLISTISIAPFLGLPISYMVITIGALLVLTRGSNAEEILDIPGIADTIIFISSLFLIAGALEASGLLDIFTGHIQSLSAISVILPTMCVLVLAFLVSTFLSAGPAAAALLPVCIQLSQAEGNTIYVALALGILAGSSMAPWSATGGPILMNETSRFIKEEAVGVEDRKDIERIYNLRYYMGFSVPFAMLLLVLSALWICTLYLI